MQNRIIKTGGYCCDGAQWNFCSYMKEITESQEVFPDVFIHQHIGQSCSMFGNTELDQGASLKVCNTVYGKSYEGNP